MQAQIKRCSSSTNDILASPSSATASAIGKPRSPKNKLKILYVGVNDDEGSLRLEQEYRAIDASVMRQPRRLELQAKFAVRPAELQAGLRYHEPDVVHFGGHGTWDSSIVVRSDCGTLSTISPDDLGSLFDIVSNNVQLVVINTCFSEEQAIAVRDSVGIAIGMSSVISDDAAITFTEAFYSALGDRCSVQEAYDSGVWAIKTLSKNVDAISSSEADIPRLLIRPDLKASDIYLITLWTPRIVFITLFLISVILAILFGSELIQKLSVYMNPVLVTKVSGTVSFDGARMPGGRISIVGHDCSGDIRDGFFEVPCESLEASVKLQIRVPEYYAARVCTREIVLKTLTHNEIVLEGCDVPSECMHSPEELIMREAALVEQNDRSVVNLFIPDGGVTNGQTGMRRPARDRYRDELEGHRFTRASHADIHLERLSGNIAYYTSSSSGRFVNAYGSGSGYNNPPRSDHWILEKRDACWFIQGLIFNAAHIPFP